MHKLKDLVIPVITNWCLSYLNIGGDLMGVNNSLRWLEGLFISLFTFSYKINQIFFLFLTSSLFYLTHNNLSCTSLSLPLYLYPPHSIDNSDLSPPSLTFDILHLTPDLQAYLFSSTLLSLKTIHSDSALTSTSIVQYYTGLSGLALKCVRNTQYVTNPGLFQIRFQYILAQQRQNILKSDLKKSRICSIS